jgi:predicted O-methyltransferase YrrM
MPIKNSIVNPFADLLAATHAHRKSHNCWAYPFDDGPSLGVLAAAVDAQRILELGTALGYSACWFALGAPHAIIDTVERDAVHVELALRNVAKQGFADRVRIHSGDFADILPILAPGYDLAFFDGFAPDEAILAAIREKLRPGGTLIAANLDLVSMEFASLRDWLGDATLWRTGYLCEGGRTAVSVKIG